MDDPVVDASHIFQTSHYDSALTDTVLKEAKLLVCGNGFEVELESQSRRGLASCARLSLMIPVGSKGHPEGEK